MFRFLSPISVSSFKPKRAYFRSRLAQALAFAWLALHAGQAAHADVWGYVDENGDTHFAGHQVDERYQLYFKTDTAPANGMGMGMGKAGGARNAVIGVHRTNKAALAFNPAADAAAGVKAQRLVRLINQSKAYLRVRDTLRQEARRNGLSIHLVKAVAAAESGFNTRAVSPVGAVGLMQIMPDTARMLGLRADKDKTVEDKLTDPAINARLGTRYLSQLLRQFGGRTDLAVAAYNAGPGAVRKRMAVPPYAETQNYVRTVLAIYETLGGTGAATSSFSSTGSLYANRTVGSSGNARRRQVVIAGSGSSGRGGKNAKGTSNASPSSPAHITLKAGDNSSDTLSALDEIAGKIASADSMLTLDGDIQIR